MAGLQVSMTLVCDLKVLRAAGWEEPSCLLKDADQALGSTGLVSSLLSCTCLPSLGDLCFSLVRIAVPLSYRLLCLQLVFSIKDFKKSHKSLRC